MNKTIALQLGAYSLVLIALSLLIHNLAPEVARPTLLTGSVGGFLSIVWAVRATLGARGKALPILTLIPVAYVLLGQAIMTWSDRYTDGAGHGAVPLLNTFLFLLSVAMLARIAYAGMFDEPSASASDRLVQSQPDGKASARKQYARGS